MFIPYRWDLNQCSPPATSWQCLRSKGSPCENARYYLLILAFCFDACGKLSDTCDTSYTRAPDLRFALNISFWRGRTDSRQPCWGNASRWQFLKILTKIWVSSGPLSSIYISPIYATFCVFIWFVSGVPRWTPQLLGPCWIHIGSMLRRFRRVRNMFSWRTGKTICIKSTDSASFSLLHWNFW